MDRRVYVECVRSNALRHVLRKHGYEGDPLSYWNARQPSNGQYIHL